MDVSDQLVTALEATVTGPFTKAVNLGKISTQVDWLTDERRSVTPQLPSFQVT